MRLQRPAHLVAQDVQRELVSSEVAESDYGVVIDGGPVVEGAAEELLGRGSRESGANRRSSTTASCPRVSVSVPVDRDSGE